jgi:3-phenylpropionate/trans-cinnamate dioxygenase ferredoxin reductase subunit
VDVLGGEQVQRLEGDGERVVALVTHGGRRIAADAVVCGVGAMPDVMLARRAGLDLAEAGGVRCDSRLRTSAEGLFAAGDMCEYDSVVHGRLLRIEHEDVAAAQGATAARNMLGGEAAHDAVPYFFSDLSDWLALEYVGPAATWDEELLCGDPGAGRFAVWYLEGGRVRAMLSAGGAGDLDRARELIAAGAAVDRHDLG